MLDRGKVNRFMFWNATTATCTESCLLGRSYHSFADLQPDKLLFLTVAPRSWRRDIWNCLLATRVSFRASRLISFTILKAFDSARPPVIYWPAMIR